MIVYNEGMREGSKQTTNTKGNHHVSTSKDKQRHYHQLGVDGDRCNAGSQFGCIGCIGCYVLSDHERFSIDAINFQNIWKLVQNALAYDDIYDIMRA